MLSTLATLMAAAFGCARRVPVGSTPADAEPAATSPLPEFVYVSVENRHSSDVVVTLVRNGQSSRLGLVSGSSSATLRFPGTYIASSASLQLAARAIGGSGSYQTGQFNVQPGQSIMLTLESQLPRSSFAVF
jgi:hypothetical protein